MVGALLLATALQVDVLSRAQTTIVPVVDLKGVDVRFALKKLFRDYQFGVTIAAEVEGTVTLDVQNLEFLEVVQILTREVDATYRIDHGWFEIVPRDDVEFARWLAASHPYRAAIERAYALRGGPRLNESVETIARWRSKPEPSVDTIARVTPHHHRPIFYEDSWRLAEKGWALDKREPSPKTPPLRFENAPVSEILQSLAERADFDWLLEGGVERTISVDLTGLSFERAFRQVLKVADATYEIKDGFVHVVPHAHVEWDIAAEIFARVRFDKTEVREALRFLFSRIGFAFSVEPDVRGRVSADWRRIPMEDALRKVLAQVGASYESGGGVIHIYRRTDSDGGHH